MSGPLRLTEPRDLDDLDTFVKRARTLSADGAVRLAASDTTLALTVEVLPGAGLLGEGTVLGMRVLRLAEPARVDEVVGLDAVADRLARMRREGSLDLAVPPVSVRAVWAALSPPRRGWQPLGVLDLEAVERVATDGVARVTQGAPAGSGAAAVADLRRRVWSEPFTQADDARRAPASGLAFGAYALGFLSGGPVTVHECARWWRLSTPTGHVLSR